MDVYSFGVIMWELFFETVPFDGDLPACIKYVASEDRPKIKIQTQDSEDGVTKPIAQLIRKCWASDPSERPAFSLIL